jgi:GT2 family glycosyltransferase
MVLEPARARAIDIIVPFYRRPDLVGPLFTSIHRVRDEMEKLHCSILAVNDSPEDRALREALAREAGRLEGILECTVLENPVNEGFVRSANRALREAIRRRHDAVLLNSDTVLFPEALREMRRVAYLDPAIGFVCPRSNNATICSLPHQREYSTLPAEEAHGLYSVLSRYLPDYHYVPTGVGFCLYLKLDVLEEVGIFDEVYSPGYNEENDLVARAQAVGKRVALANRAYVYHAGVASFSDNAAELEKRNAETLTRRYPNFKRHVDEYYQGAHYQAEILLAGLLADQDGRRNLLVTGNLRLKDNREIQEAAEQWRQEFNVFFNDDRETPQIFAAAVSFGLPAEYSQLVRLSKSAAVNVYVVPGRASLSLDSISDFVSQYADGVVYAVTGEFLRGRLDGASLETMKRRLGAIRLAGEMEKVKREALEKSELARVALEEAVTAIESLREEARQHEAALQAENDRLTEELRERRHEIDDLRRSRVWRWSAPFRRLADMFLTRRR